MKVSRRLIGWLLLLSSLLLVSAAGTYNMAARHRVPFSIARDDGFIIVSRFEHPFDLEWGALEGNRLLELNGQPVGSLAEAGWILRWIPSDSAVVLTVQREDSVFRVAVPASHSFPVGFLLLDRVTGIAFLFLGLLVGWRAGRDKMAWAFMRINLLTGVAVLLAEHENLFRTWWLRDGYSLLWASSMILIPAALTQFVFRFTSRTAPPPPERSHSEIKEFQPEPPAASRLASAAFYLPALMLAGAVALSHLMAMHTGEAQWIAHFDLLQRTGTGLYMVAMVSICFVRLIYAWLRSADEWQRRRNRWLLLCTIAGIAPFVFFEKLPTLWGWSPLMPAGVSMTMLLIAPIGWGMAISSFGMMKVELTLSRSMVYLITAGILVLFVSSLTILTAEYARRNELSALPVIVVVGSVLVLLAALALYERVKWAVDRVYYGDWFDYRRAIQELEGRLSHSFQESEIVSIVTSELPPILRISRSTLLIHSTNPGGQSHSAVWEVRPPEHAQRIGESGTYALPVQGTPTGRVLPLRSGHPLARSGYALAVPLEHGDEILGWMLLGAKHSGATYSERDFQLLESLSQFAGMALANMELSRQLLDHERRATVVTLAGGIAHEIGNALSPLMGQAQLIEFTLNRHPERLTPEFLSQPVRVMVDMCNRIKRIAQNLNRLSQPMKLEKLPVSLNDVAEDAVQLMSETAGRIKRYHVDGAAANQPDVTADTPFVLRKQYDRELPTVMGDAQQLSQVFVNLILNAADALEQTGKGTLTVGTRYFPDEQTVAGFVEDTGTGIPPTLIEKIFQPYFTTKPPDKGSGLGLAIVRSIIEAHDGRIRVSSREGQGTRMEFLLPVAPPATR